MLETSRSTSAAAASAADPADPVAAVTHPDPYPYYARLVAGRPLYADAGLGLWVATGAAAVEAVLGSGLCRVRPPAEPVPAALLGTPAAELFRHLVRVNDGDRHGPMKQVVAVALGALDERQAAAVSREWARELAAELRPERDPGRLQELGFRLPVYVVASLLGVGRALLEPVARWTGELAAGFAPGADPAQVERCGAAVEALRGVLGSPAGGLLAALAAEARRAGCEAGGAVVANGIGLLLQSYEATAGLIGNTLMALARHPEVREQVRADPRRLGEAVAEVLRWDPPVQNTRRFVARAGEVAGRGMREGDAVLVVLAAAGRDPAVCRDPQRFDPARAGRRLFTFGAGLHACPGPSLAAAIAREGVAALLAAGVDPEPLAAAVTYRPSANLRIPVFAA
jgi:cytochrome P450